MADSAGSGIAQPLGAVPAPTAAGGARYVVFGGVRQYGQFVFEPHIIQLIGPAPDVN